MAQDHVALAFEACHIEVLFTNLAVLNAMFSAPGLQDRTRMHTNV